MQAKNKAKTRRMSDFSNSYDISVGIGMFDAIARTKSAQRAASLAHKHTHKQCREIIIENVNPSRSISNVWKEINLTLIR